MIEVCRAGCQSIRKHGALSPASARVNCYTASLTLLFVRLLEQHTQPHEEIETNICQFLVREFLMLDL